MSNKRDSDWSESEPYPQGKKQSNQSKREEAYCSNDGKSSVIRRRRNCCYWDTSHRDTLLHLMGEQ